MVIHVIAFESYSIYIEPGERSYSSLNYNSYEEDAYNMPIASFTIMKYVHRAWCTLFL